MQHSLSIHTIFRHGIDFFLKLCINFQGVQLHIEIWDDDSHFPDSDPRRPNELIDVLLINHDLPIGQPSTRQNYTGIYSFKFVTMDLSITVRCVKNFQGSDCSRCLPSFAGAMCNIKISECDCSGHGQCFDGVPSLTCDCDPGFTGKLCQTNINDCAGVDCNNGECFDGVNSFICQCNSGFGGPFCTEGVLASQSTSCQVMNQLLILLLQ